MIFVYFVLISFISSSAVASEKNESKTCSTTFRSASKPSSDGIEEKKEVFVLYKKAKQSFKIILLESLKSPSTQTLLREILVGESKKNGSYFDKERKKNPLSFNEMTPDTIDLILEETTLGFSFRVLTKLKSKLESAGKKETYFYLLVQEKLRQIKKTRDDLFIRNHRLIYFVVHKNRPYWQAIGLIPRLKIEELVQIGSIGFITAMDRFDIRRDVNLSTYVAHAIKRHILKFARTLNKTIRTPDYLYKHSFIINKYIALYEEKNGKKPSPKEIAKGTELSLKQVERVLEAEKFKIDSTEKKIKDTNLSLGETLPSDDLYEELDISLDSLKNKQTIEGGLLSLNEREQEILKQRLLIDEPKTLEEVGKSLGVSRERVRQIQKEALRKLKLYIEKNNPHLKDEYTGDHQ
ncbi:MAG: hypothetical protein CL678_07235 [Bdellovibrionaceae bacterium]|nr:hypothetical protein [Pseudobdellovibrionaceae bacterium]|tara:strand:+ start:574 stop:1797 length:1224 start_codon:yes stop_codon:yes gene_type:complete